MLRTLSRRPGLGPLRTPEPGCPRIPSACCSASTFSTRRPFPAAWQFDLGVPPRGLVIFLRRTDPQGRVALLGHTFDVSPDWHHRVVRAEVRLPNGPIRLFALRRRDPGNQPLLREIPYRLPKNRWRLTE